MNAAAGKRAFIPDIEDRDLCYNAVKIFSLAAQEALLIPDEFCQEFGDVGIDIYNDLIEIIGEQDKNCLLFVNMCLRTWLNHLIVDTDLLGDMSPFNFDKWVEEKMARPVVHNHYAKTSYKLMLAVFGDTTDRTGAMDTVSQIDHSDLPPSWSSSPSTPTNTTTQKGSTNLGKVVDTNNTALSERSSKLKNAGDQVRERLLKSYHLRFRKRSTKAVNAKITAVMDQSSKSTFNNHTMRSCRVASQKMEDLLFSVGGAERIVVTLRCFRDRKAVKEVDRVEETTDAEKPNEEKLKEGRLQSVLIDGLKNFPVCFIVHVERMIEEEGGAL